MPGSNPGGGRIDDKNHGQGSCFLLRLFASYRCRLTMHIFGVELSSRAKLLTPALMRYTALSKVLHTGSAGWVVASGPSLASPHQQHTCNTHSNVLLLPPWTGCRVASRQSRDQAVISPRASGPLPWASEALSTGLLVLYRPMGTHSTAVIAGGAGKSVEPMVEPSFCCPVGVTEERGEGSCQS